MAEIIAINSELHQGTKIRSNPNFLQSAKRHFVGLVVHEFVAASQEFPVVFIKDADTGQFKAIGLLGLKPGENLFYSDQGWQASYVPEALNLYPFVLHQNSKDDRAVLCFDASSPLINVTEGEALFDQNAQQTPWLSAQSERVVQYVEKGFVTQHFIKMLLDKNLLSPQTLNIKLDEEYNVNGLYTIDEAKLNALPEQDFLELRKIGFLPAIYASLLSMQRIQHLVRRKMGK